MMIKYLFMERLSRRKLLVLPVAAALSGCGHESSPSPDDPKTKLITEANLLPDSTIKSLLLSRTLPLYQKKPPFILNYAGIPITVHDARVVYNYQAMGNRAGGSVTMRENNLPLESTVATTQTLHFPLVSGITPSEVAQYFSPKNHQLPDGTPFIDRTFNPGNPFYNGLAPLITIDRSTNISPLQRADFARIERFGFIKEACGLLLITILLEESAKEMIKQHLPTQVQVLNKSHNPTTTEAVSNLLGDAFNHAGRISALTDLASYLLAFSATSSTDYFPSLKVDPKLRAVIDQVGNKSYGTDSISILHNSFDTVLATPVLSQLDYQGAMNMIP